MEKINLKYLVTLSLIFLSMACSSSGTEVGNPGSKRQVSGALVSQVSPNGVAPNSATLVKTVNTASCPENEGVISVYFVPVSGSSYSVESDSSGDFSKEIDQQQRYEVEFRQNGISCGALFFAQKPDFSSTNEYDPVVNGEHVILGKGTISINLGSITDLGNGVFVSENNPASYCDDDNDGESDDIDDDANGDGQDDGDADDDGYVDWYDDEAGEAVEVGGTGESEADN